MEVGPVLKGKTSALGTVEGSRGPTKSAERGGHLVVLPPSLSAVLTISFQSPSRTWMETLSIVYRAPSLPSSASLSY